MAASLVMLTDADPAPDLRVLDAWRSHGQPELQVVAERGPLAIRFACAALAALALPWLAIVHWRALCSIAIPAGRRSGWPLAGLRKFVDNQAIAVGHYLRHRGQLRGAQAIYAHDQRCGVVALLCRRLHGTPYEYDAHEIVPFRPRRAGAARVLLEYTLERRIVRGARTCHVVDQPMRQLYRRLYGPASLVVRPNDFFADREIALDPDGARLMVYVGATGAHRRLEAMARITHVSGGEVLLCCDGAAGLAATLGATALCDLSGYQEALAARVAGNAPYVWCAFDPAVLSYRYSLPNKFFQAMAWGMPIVAQRGTYLARLVRRHGFGLVIDAADAQQTVPWEPGTYRRAADAMRRFRSALRSGQVVV